MNCQQLSQLLDEQDLSALPPTLRENAEMHLSHCADCARDHRAMQALAGLPIPALPLQQGAQWRMQALQRTAAASRTWRTRGAVIGAGLALAAAAAINTYQSSGQPARDHTPTTATAAKEAAPVPQPAASAPEVAPTALPQPSVSSPRITAAAVPPPRLYTLLIEPLHYETEDPLARAGAEDFFTALLSGLRALPGVRVDGPTTYDPAAAPTDLRLRVAAHAPDDRQFRDAQWMARLRLHVQHGNARRVQPFSVGGMLPGESCAAMTSQTSACAPTDMATALVASLRRIALPPDPALETQLQAQLLDATQPGSVRQEALRQLLNLRGTAALDDAGMAAALDVIARAATDDARRESWQLLRGVSHPALVQPLIDTVQHSANAPLRREAIALLASGFAHDTVARAALADIQRQDSSELLREVAGRALHGDAGWQTYAIRVARDETRTPDERLAPLTWMTRTGDRGTLAVVLNSLLEDDAGEVLWELLNTPSNDLETRVQGQQLLHAVRVLPHPAAARFRIAAADGVSDATR